MVGFLGVTVCNFAVAAQNSIALQQADAGLASIT
jgi:hypothetical protein